MVTKTAAFEQAIKDSRNLKAKPTNDELLKVSIAICFCLSQTVMFRRLRGTDYFSNSFTPISSKAAKTHPLTRPINPALST